MQTSMLLRALRAALVFAGPPTATLLGGARATTHHNTTSNTAGHDQKIYPEDICEYDVERKIIVELSKEERGDRQSIEVFYPNNTGPTYRDGMIGMVSSYVERPPARQPIGTRESDVAFFRSFTRTSGQNQHFEAEVTTWMVHHQA